MFSRIRAALGAGATAILAAGLAIPPGAASSTHSGSFDVAQAVPALKVTRVVGSLGLPWDVQRVPGGNLLITERNSGRVLRLHQGRLSTVADLSGRVWVAGEAGLMSMAADPNFSANRRLFVCLAANTATGHEVRVERLTLNRTLSGVTESRVMLRGLPAVNGFHAGCRLQIDRNNGALMIGTGDATVGTNPQDLTSLGGKVLRINRHTGWAWPSNPFITSKNTNTRKLFTLGHRNVQGLAQRADGRWWSVEQGTDRDDEVNKLVRGGNYGWNPVPGYDQTTPMTDLSLPGAIPAAWSSGDPTLATSGGAWVRGAQWGDLDGTLAVASLKTQRVTFMKFAADGTLIRTWTPAELTTHGRLRSVTSLPNGNLLITTSNGSNNAVLRVTPQPQARH